MPPREDGSKMLRPPATRVRRWGPGRTRGEGWHHRGLQPWPQRGREASCVGRKRRSWAEMQALPASALQNQGDVCGAAQSRAARARETRTPGSGAKRAPSLPAPGVRILTSWDSCAFVCLLIAW